MHIYVVEKGTKGCTKGGTNAPLSYKIYEYPLVIHASRTPFRTPFVDPFVKKWIVTTK